MDIIYQEFKNRLYLLIISSIIMSYAHFIDKSNALLAFFIVSIGFILLIFNKYVILQVKNYPNTKSLIFIMYLLWAILFIKFDIVYGLLFISIFFILTIINLGKVETIYNHEKEKNSPFKFFFKNPSLFDILCLCTLLFYCLYKTYCIY